LVQVLEKSKFKELIVQETTNLQEIKDALDEMIYIPFGQLKPNIIHQILKYFEAKINDNALKIKIFVSYINRKITGVVSVQVNPNYTSYGRNCGTFSWLYAKDYISCEELMERVELFVKEQGLKKIRGPINFPKHLGGIGLQIEGFDKFPMYGVAISDSSLKIINYLEKLGYLKESYYSCLHIYQEFWENAKKLDKSVRLGYLSKKEFLRDRKEELLQIGKEAFGGILPDTSGCEDNLREFADIYSKVPNSFYTIKSEVNTKLYADVPQIAEALESFDPKKQLLWVGVAFDKATDDILGTAYALPNLYQLWDGDPITQVNADTMMVKTGQSGKGIFSALNALGQMNFKRYGLDYIEGTSIWSNNERVMERIFPHTKLVRKHVVMQKRIK